MSRRLSNDLYRSSDLFRKVATKTAHGVGHPLTFAGAVLVVVVWASSGHFFRYSDTWQLVINTGTTIVTFLMVFLIQNTQNRDSHAIHLKLDELIHANKHARNRMMALEELSEEELDDLQKEFDRLASAKVAERRERDSQSPPSSKRQKPRAAMSGADEENPERPEDFEGRVRGTSRGR
jgi:low affinity Fe/Cu permease